MLNIIFIFVLFVSLLVLSVFLSNVAFKKGAKAKKVLASQVLAFLFIPLICAGASALTTNAANEAPSTTASQATTETKASSNHDLGYIAMAVSIGLGSLGAGIAVAAAAPAAIGATSEDPKSFGKSLVFVALAEGVCIFSLLISFFIYIGLR